MTYVRAGQSVSSSWLADNLTVKTKIFLYMYYAYTNIPVFISNTFDKRLLDIK